MSGDNSFMCWQPGSYESERVDCDGGGSEAAIRYVIRCLGITEGVVEVFVAHEDGPSLARYVVDVTANARVVS